MSDIDYSKFSYRDYKKGRSNYKNKRGRIRYNFIDYVERTSYTPTYDTTLINPIIDDTENKSQANKAVDDDNLSDDDYRINDLRSANKRRPRAKNTMNRRKDIIAIMLIIICFSITVAATDMLSGGNIFANINSVFTSATGTPVYYAVEIGSFPDMDSARATSDLYRLRDAGGYVINDGSYRVIAAVYPNKDDAETIVNKLIQDGVGGAVYEIRGANVNWDKYGTIGNDLKQALVFAERVFDELYIISNDLDRGDITENDAKIKIKTLHEEAVSTRNALIDNTRDYSYDDTVISARIEISSYAAILDNLNNDNIPRPSLLADIRYSSTLIAHTYCRILRELK